MSQGCLLNTGVIVYHKVGFKAFLPKVKLDFGRRTFLLIAAKLIKELPENIVYAENIQTLCYEARRTFLFAPWFLEHLNCYF